MGHKYGRLGHFVEGKAEGRLEGTLNLIALNNRHRTRLYTLHSLKLPDV